MAEVQRGSMAARAKAKWSLPGALAGMTEHDKQNRSWTGKSFQQQPPGRGVIPQPSPGQAMGQGSCFTAEPKGIGRLPGGFPDPTRPPPPAPSPSPFPRCHFSEDCGGKGSRRTRTLHMFKMGHLSKDHLNCCIRHLTGLHYI